MAAAETGVLAAALRFKAAALAIVFTEGIDAGHCLNLFPRPETRRFVAFLTLKSYITVRFDVLTAHFFFLPRVTTDLVPAYQDFPTL
jgi:hypothetical protein